MENQPKAVAVTDKGVALLAAIEAGLVPQAEDGYDIEPFEKFWEIYSEKSLRNFESCLKQAHETTNDLIKMLNDEREQRARDRADDRIAQGRLLLAAFGGMIFGHFLPLLF